MNSSKLWLKFVIPEVIVCQKKKKVKSRVDACELSKSYRENLFLPVGTIVGIIDRVSK